MKRRRSALRASALALVLAGACACSVIAGLDKSFVQVDCLDDCGADAAPDVADATDAPVDALDAGDAGDAAVQCDPYATFVDIHPVVGLETTPVFSAYLSDNELSMFLAKANPARVADTDLFEATRPSTSKPFSIIGPVPVVNSASSEYWATLGADGKLLFFESSRSLTKVDGGYVDDRARIWSATRVSTASDFGEPFIQSLFQTDGGQEASPFLHRSGRALYFSSLYRPGHGDFDLFQADLDELGIVQSVRNLDGANTKSAEIAPIVADDQKTIFFGRDTYAVTAYRDVYVAHRNDPAGDFSSATRVAELSDDNADDFPSWLSLDSCRLYFVTNRVTSGDAGVDTYRLWVAERPLPK